MYNTISETITENLFRKYYGTDVFLEKSAISKQYGFKSKKGTQYKGFPDFFLDANDYVIIVETKAIKHQDAIEEIQFYMLNNNIRSKKDIIGIAVSGQSNDTIKTTYFYLLKNEDTIKGFLGNTGFTSLNIINESFLNKKYGDTITNELLTTILMNLNKKFHNNNIKDADRSLFFSGIMIALNNSNFRNIYKNIQQPSDKEKLLSQTILLESHYLNIAILDAIENELKYKINNLSKMFLWKDRFSFIKIIDIPLFEYQEIIEIIETKIYIPFIKNEKLDILSKAYKIFLKKAGKIDNKNIILTPDHIKQLMIKLARLSKDDVVLDTCTGSGGFLIEAMETMINLACDNQNKIKEIKEKQLLGFEINDVLFSLACTNMFLHGDGMSNMIFRNSILDMSKQEDKKIFDYIKLFKPTKIIINPPYENNKPINFTLQALNFLEPNGKLIIIMPSPTLLQNSKNITKEILKIAKLDFVIKMPMTIFSEQHRTVCTSIFGFTKTPHNKNDEVIFYNLKDDCLVSVQHKGRIDKYNKWNTIENNILESIFNKKEIPMICESKKIYINDELVCCGVKATQNDNFVKFGDLFDTNTFGTLKSEDAELNGEFDFITAAETWKKHTSYKYDKEAIVYAVSASGSLGRAHYVNGKFIASTLCLVLTPKNNKQYPIDLEFYSYYLIHMRNQIVNTLKKGTSKLTINHNDLANYPIEYIDINKQLLLKNSIKKQIIKINKLKTRLLKEEEKLINNNNKFFNNM